MIARALSLALVVVTSFAAFGAGRDIAPRALGPSPFQASSAPHVAHAGGRFLTVWRESIGQVGARMMAALSDASGRRISPSSIVLGSTHSWDFDVVGMGDAFAVFWTDNFYVTHMLEVDLDGRITATRIVALPANIERAIVWNGTHFLAALKLPLAETHDAEAVLFTRDGTIVRRGIPIDDYAYWFDVAVVDSGFFVFTTGWFGLYAHHITADGNATQTLIEAPVGPTLPSFRPQRVTSTTIAGNAWIAWSSGDAVGFEVKTAMVTPSLDVSTPRVVTSSNHILSPLQLMRNDAGFLLAYTEHAAPAGPGLVHARLLRADGSSADVPERAPVQIGGYVHTAAASSSAIVVAAQTIELASAITVAVDRTALVHAPELISISLSRQAQPALGAGGGRLAAAWTEYSGIAGTLRGAAIDADGRPLGSTTLEPNVALVATDLAWSGSEYLAIGRRDDHLVAQRLTIDAEPIDEPIVIAATYSNAEVAWASDRWVILWKALNDEVFFASVSPVGIATEVRQLPLSPPPPPDRFRLIHEIAVAFDGPDGMVVWTEELRRACWFPLCEPGEIVTMAARIERDGTLTGVRQMIDVDHARLLSVAAGDDDFAIVIDANATVLTIVDHQLQTIARRSFHTTGLSDVTWDGSAYVIATRDARHLVVRRGDTVRATPILPSDDSAPPSIAAAIAGNAVIVVQEADLSNGTRAVVYAERDLELFDETPPRRRSVRK